MNWAALFFAHSSSAVEGAGGVPERSGGMSVAEPGT